MMKIKNLHKLRAWCLSRDSKVLAELLLFFPFLPHSLEVYHRLFRWQSLALALFHFFHGRWTGLHIRSQVFCPTYGNEVDQHHFIYLRDHTSMTYFHRHNFRRNEKISSMIIDSFDKIWTSKPTCSRLILFFWRTVPVEANTIKWYFRNFTGH